MNMTKSVWLIALLAAGGAFANESGSASTERDNEFDKDEYWGLVADGETFSDWDNNNDGLLSRYEFSHIGLDSDFSIWDSDNNLYLNSTEFYDSAYTHFDENEDGHWDDHEWDDLGGAGWWNW